MRLAPRPVFLAGREGLLAELDARLVGRAGTVGAAAGGVVRAGRCGEDQRGGGVCAPASAEVGVCWQFAAEDPAVLAAEFAVLAAQLGVRDLVDPRDPVAAVHAVLARQEAGWLLVFDNVPDRASIEPFLPPAGPGRVLITTQNQHWPPGQALEVPVLDPQVAADFLVNRTGDPDRASASGLAAELDGLPLALEQAAAYIQATGTDSGPVSADVPGPAGWPTVPRRGRRAPSRRCSHPGASGIPAGRAGPCSGGAGAALGVHGS